jgi:type IV pilus assembly protein PilV
VKISVQRNDSGFTLIEVLISILILSVGVLGITSMQFQALAANRNALLRIEASQLTVDLVDRIEANSRSVYGPIDLGDVPTPVTDCGDGVNDCSPALMVEFDLTQWLCSINSVNAAGDTYESCDDLGISGSLPLGQASIQTIDDEYSIRVQWTEARTNRTSSVQLFMQIPL